MLYELMISRDTKGNCFLLHDVQISLFLTVSPPNLLSINEDYFFSSPQVLIQLRMRGTFFLTPKQSPTAFIQPLSISTLFFFLFFI
jgi:hypothetical protein